MSILDDINEAAERLLREGAKNDYDLHVGIDARKKLADELMIGPKLHPWPKALLGPQPEVDVLRVKLRDAEGREAIAWGDGRCRLATVLGEHPIWHSSMLGADEWQLVPNRWRGR